MHMHMHIASARPYASMQLPHRHVRQSAELKMRKNWVNDRRRVAIVHCFSGGCFRSLAFWGLRVSGSGF